MLSAVSEVSLAARLHEFGLLPEERRRDFVQTVTEYAVDGEDLYALESDSIRSIFTDAEFDCLRKRVRHELLPRLDRVRSDWQFNRSSDGSAGDHMQPFLESLETLKKELATDVDAIRMIDREIELANEWIAENDEEDGGARPGRTIGKVGESTRSSLDGRSIFDDIDE